LEQQFDVICGDTFCEGDYSNYQSLGMRCSVERSSGRVGACSWAFAASNVEVAAANGQLTTDARTWACEIPVAPGTRLSTLISVLSQPAEPALYAALPGTGRSAFDGIADCL
jgi:hypothetical protein